jgi:hypothetical protein
MISRQVPITQNDIPSSPHNSTDVPSSHRYQVSSITGTYRAGAQEEDGDRDTSPTSQDMDLTSSELTGYQLDFLRDNRIVHVHDGRWMRIMDIPDGEYSMTPVDSGEVLAARAVD